MCELPIDPAIPAATWQRVYGALLACGAPIDRVNRVRMRLSSVKGGRLAIAAGRAHTQTTLLASDVPGDSALVASAPTSVSVFDQAADTLAEDVVRLGVAPALPADLRERIANGELPPLPEASDAIRKTSHQVTLIDERLACEFAAGRARQLGWVVDTAAEVDDWPCERAADELLQRLRALPPREPRPRRGDRDDRRALRAAAGRTRHGRSQPALRTALREPHRGRADHRAELWHRRHRRQLPRRRRHRRRHHASRGRAMAASSRPITCGASTRSACSMRSETR